MSKSHRCQFNVNKIPDLGFGEQEDFIQSKQINCETIQLFNSMDMEQHSLEQVVWGRPHKEAAGSQLPCHSSAQTRLLHFALARQVHSSVTASARETQFATETESVLQETEGRLT